MVAMQKANNLEELLCNDLAYGTVEVRPGLTVSYDHRHGDYWTVAIDDAERYTDMREDVLAWIEQKEWQDG